MIKKLFCAAVIIGSGFIAYGQTADTPAVPDAPRGGTLKVSHPICKNGVVIAFHFKASEASEGNMYINHEAACAGKEA